MTDERKPLWPWIVMITLGVVVIVAIASLVWRFVNPPVSPLANEEDPRSVIQVEVVNASGRSGAGRQVMEFLRQRGFDVVEIGNDTARPRRSSVIDRVGDRTSARKVAQSLGIADSLITTDLDSMRFLQSSIIIGADLDNLEPFAE
ncbi:MAG: hypothetical protein RLZZ150_890 [Bacteroidota bacterium]|jgi:hypothetical protein